MTKECRKRHIENGLCIYCSKLQIPNSQTCLEHWFGNISRMSLGSVKLRFLIWNLAEKQNYICTYTGEKLIPGQNMSLDHIQSKYDRPDLIHDINNVQWVTLDINRVKNKLSHEAFVKLCHRISNKFS